MRESFLLVYIEGGYQVVLNYLILHDLDGQSLFVVVDYQIATVRDSLLRQVENLGPLQLKYQTHEVVEWR